ncbi:hypothetical protein [Pontimicrobium sp. IMCC45349]|uniref:hypothetical protein n=1 Tax=Pontimicrobium sp. IMCC45349 TaxID=3391574 RepID=UPI00399EEF41
MLRFIQKILLTLVSISISLLLLFAIFMLLVEEEKNFEISMLLPFAIVVFSALSFVFHLKTLSFYRKDVITKAHYRKDKPFWIANLVFAFSLFLLALFFVISFTKF